STAYADQRRQWRHQLASIRHRLQNAPSENERNGYVYPDRADETMRNLEAEFQRIFTESIPLPQMPPRTVTSRDFAETRVYPDIQNLEDRLRQLAEPRPRSEEGEGETQPIEGEGEVPNARRSGVMAPAITKLDDALQRIFESERPPAYNPQYAGVWADTLIPGTATAPTRPTAFQGRAFNLGEQAQPPPNPNSAVPENPPPPPRSAEAIYPPNSVPLPQPRYDPFQAAQRPFTNQQPQPPILAHARNLGQNIASDLYGSAREGIPESARIFQQAVGGTIGGIARGAENLAYDAAGRVVQGVDYLGRRIPELGERIAEGGRSVTRGISDVGEVF